VNIAVLADDHVLINVHAGINIGEQPDSGRGMHSRVAGNPHVHPLSRGSEHAQDFQERDFGVIDDQNGLGNVGEFGGFA
jgi:hypothetical protein